MSDDSKSADEKPAPPPHPRPAAEPTQRGPDGIQYDFNDGCRVLLPPLSLPGSRWRVRLRDLDTGNILYETRLAAGLVKSAKRYYLRARIEVWHDDENRLTHDYDARGRPVLIQFPVGTLGDTIGWFPYAVKFQQKHGCDLTCVMAAWLIPLFRDAYPHISFVTPEEVVPEASYATYNLGLYFDDDECLRQPCDFRLVGLHRTAGYILDVDPADTAPRLSVADDARPIAEPYVVIATQSTTQAKYWTNPNGWREVIRFLREAGFRVICIDRKPAHGHGLVWNQIPNGAEDQTGDRPLSERVHWLRHAAFFVGLSSGLSWLAWAAGTPVVLISGFTLPMNEFETPYRVINYHACNGCWNDVRVRFDHKDFLWCPRHAGTDRQFECSRLITAEHVKSVITRVPAFRQVADVARAALR